MPHPVSLSEEQRLRWERDGVLKLEALLDQAAVARAQDAVLAALARLGLWRDGDWRLDARPRPTWPDQGLKPARDIGHRHPEVEALIRQPALKAVVEQLGGAEFDRKIYPRPQVLASLPNIGRWRLPDGWHTDMPRLARGGSPGVQVFMFLDSVRPRGGGPLVVAGSHLLLNDGRNMKVNEITATLRREPFFHGLFGSGVEATEHDPLPSACVRDVRLEVVEIVGEPGDVWLMDLRALHAAAPNALDRPRLMATHRFVRAERMPEIAEAFGWKAGV